MSSFIKQHLQLKSVNSNCVSREPIQHYLGKFMPPDFAHIEGPRRGVDVLARQQTPQPARKFDLIGETIQSVRNGERVQLIG